MNLTSQLNQQPIERNRKLLRGIKRTLAIEEEILTSPLSHRFETALERIKHDDLTTGR